MLTAFVKVLSYKGRSLPGAIVTTLMPLGYRSLARGSVIDAMAPLLAAYAA